MCGTKLKYLIVMIKGLCDPTACGGLEALQTMAIQTQSVTSLRSATWLERNHPLIAPWISA